MDNEQKTRPDEGGLFAPYFNTPNNDTFKIKQGQRTYEVVTRFCGDGKQSVLQQFKELILSEVASENRTFDNAEKKL